jgi:hypothetical protein
LSLLLLPPFVVSFTAYSCRTCLTCILCNFKHYLRGLLFYYTVCNVLLLQL